MKKIWSFGKLRSWKVGAIAVLIFGLFSSQAKAWTNPFLDQLIGTGGLLEQLTKISEAFNKELRNITGITNEAIAQITGELGYFDPDKAPDKIEPPATLADPLQGVINTGMSEIATSRQAGSRILSSATQKFDKDRITNLTTAAKESVTLATEVDTVGTGAQNQQSSQEILKAMAKQNINISKIMADNVQMSLAGATDSQQSKMQLAALNQVMATVAEQGRSARQNQILQENKASLAAIVGNSKNMSAGLE
jgi:hypothetical protein